MKPVGRIELKARVALPRREPRRRDGEEQTVHVRGGEGVRLDRAWEVLLTPDCRPDRIERGPRADLRNLGREAFGEDAEAVAVRLDRRRSLLQHDELPAAARDLAPCRALVPVIPDEREIRSRYSLHHELVATR